MDELVALNDEQPIVLPFNQKAEAITFLLNGNYAVAYTDDRSGVAEVYIQIFDSSGTPVGDAVQVSSDDGVGQTEISLATSDNGDILVAWNDSPGSTGHVSYFSRLTQDGQVISGPTSYANEFWSGVYDLPNGAYALKSASSVSIFDHAGQQVATLDYASEAYLRIASNDQGYAITSLNSSSELIFQSFDAFHQSLTPEIKVNTSGGYLAHPEITVLENGNYVVTWHSDILGNNDVYAQILDAQGNKLGNEILVNDSPDNNHATPSITSLSDGGFYIVWFGSHSVPVQREVYGQRFDQDGNQVGTIQKLNDQGVSSGYREVTELENGDIAVVWDVIDLSTGDAQLVTRVFDVSGHGAVQPPANNAPELNSVVTDVQLDESDSIDFSLPVGLFSDPDGDALTITATLADGSDLPAWLVFDAASQSFSGSADDAGIYEIEVSAFDGEFTTSTRFTIDVEAAPAPVNTAPIIDQLILDQEAHLDESFQFSVPADAFSDLDGDTLSYSAQLANGEPLPSWLNFDGQNFSGTPTRFSDPLAIEIVASDGIAQASQVFTLVLNTPVWGVGDYHRGELKVGSDEGINLGEYAFIDENGADTLSFSFSDSAGNNVDWLSIEQVHNGWAVTGDQTNTEVGLHEIFLTATDGHFDRTMQLDITVLAGNGAPIAGASDLEVVFQKSQLFKMAPQGLFTDPEGDTLTYNATNLPDWLYFNPSNGFMMSRSTELYDSVLLNIEASDGDNVAVNTLKVEEHNTDWTEQAMSFGDGSTGRILVQDVDGDATLQSDEALVVNDTLVNVDDLAILRLYQATSTDATSTQFEADKALSDTSVVAQGLVESSEFVALADADENGAVSNDELIAHLYNANHGRSATTAEESYWQARFNTDGASQGEVVTEFASSDEYADASTEAVANLIHQNEDWWS